MSDYDIVIAGGGHNSLVCGAKLAQAGLNVLVAESNPWVGGGAVTRELTLPGFKHDLGGDSHIWIHANKDFNELLPELENYGLKYIWAEEHIQGHPLAEGPGIVVYKNIDDTCHSIAAYSQRDAHRYKEIYEGFLEIKESFVKGMFSPPAPPSYESAELEKTRNGLKVLYNYRLSARAFAVQNFENEYVRAFILGWAMGPQITPDQDGGGRSCYIMIPGVHVYGQAVPEGGSMNLPLACARYIEAYGGKVLTDSRVARFIIANGRCRGIRLADGTEILARRAVVSGLDPQQTFLRLMDESALNQDFVSMVRNYDYGNVSEFRIYFALEEPPRLSCSDAINKTDFQRFFGTIDETIKHFAEMSMGRLPSRPFFHALCFSKRDRSRAPAGKHTLTVDTFVPAKLSSGEHWDDIKESYGQLLLQRLREFTTNMQDDNILGYALETPITIAASNASYVDGTVSGGTKCQSQMGYFRPFPGYAHYKSPIKDLYLTGPSCHPGDGITAMGTITANVMLADFGMQRSAYRYLLTPAEWL